MLIKEDLIIQPLMRGAGHRVDVLRLDLIHPEVSGNKWFKLKLNLKEAERQNKKTLLTFGGAYSNHIAATAFAAYELGFKSIGVIRGEAPSQFNDTLSTAKERGMNLFFVDRENYKRRDDPAFLEVLKEKYGDFYLVPEGGKNTLGMLGCKSIAEANPDYDYLMCACGTGTTYAGLMLGKQNRQVLIGVNVLKGKNELVEETKQLLSKSGETYNPIIVGNEALEKNHLEQSCIIDHYAFSGYAAYDKTLIDFKHGFELKHQIPLDYVYTTKLFYAFFDLLEKRKFKKGASVLLIHSGGIQGNEGFEKRYHQKPMR
ncbi:MAG: pyridoxal-phosphate dependent enzyme [Bacteroidia bacterium]|nr:pyridoxal-phosphate dependent enzyme [Bacteroidia bacterium]